MSPLTTKTQFKEITVCLHCDALTEERFSGDEGWTFCSDGCGCLEGWDVINKFLCPHCGETCNDEKCNCEGYVVNQLETNRTLFILEATESTGEIWYEEMIARMMRQTNEVLIPYLTGEKKLSRLTIF